jgi:hypothetical protein
LGKILTQRDKGVEAQRTWEEVSGVAGTFFWRGVFFPFCVSFMTVLSGRGWAALWQAKRRDVERFVLLGEVEFRELANRPGDCGTGQHTHENRTSNNLRHRFYFRTLYAPGKRYFGLREVV